MEMNFTYDSSLKGEAVEQDLFTFLRGLKSGKLNGRELYLRQLVERGGS
jgi:hypothetical protein